MEFSENILEYIQAISVLTNICQKYMFAPGYVENQVVIVETNGLLSIPFVPAQKIIECLMTNFTCTLERIFITNPSWIFNTCWNFACKFVS